MDGSPLLTVGLPSDSQAQINTLKEHPFKFDFYFSLFVVLSFTTWPCCCSSGVRPVAGVFLAQGLWCPRHTVVMLGTQLPSAGELKTTLYSKQPEMGQ